MGRQYMRWFLASLEPLLRSFGSEDREPNIQQLLFIGVVDHQALPHISYEYCSCAKLQHGSNSRGVLNFHHLTLTFFYGVKQTVHYDCGFTGAHFLQLIGTDY